MWGPGPQGGFQNALAMGLQLGGMARQQQDQRNERNALAAFAQNPSKETVAAVAPYKPELAYKFTMDERAATAEQQLAADTAAALGGDTAAKQRILTKNFDRWQVLDKAEKDRLAAEGEQLGGAALYALNQPDMNATRQIVLQYGQQNQSPEIMQLAQLPDEQLKAALQKQIFNSGLVKDLMALEETETIRLGPGDGLYGRDPRTGAMSTIVEPNLGGAPAFSPVGQTPAPTPAGTKSAPPSKQVGNATYYQNPETGKWYDNPQEAMGGGASNGTGGFQGP
jgi:hypothetical protein